MTPDDYPQLLAESHDRSAFANADEGYGWMAANCDRCIHDKPARNGHDDQGCPLLLITLLGRTPRQFIDGPRDEHGRYGIPDQYLCTEFRGDDDPDPQPRPVPVPPGQGELLPREPFEGHRMLTPLGPQPTGTTDAPSGRTNAAGLTPRRTR